MKIRAVFLDMDGTLLNPDNRISGRNKDAVLRLVNQGVKVFLATGRQFEITRPYHRQLGLTTPMICLNGAAVYDSFSAFPVYTKNVHIQRESFHSIAEEPQCNAIIHTTDGTFVKRPSAETRRWEQESGKKTRYMPNLRQMPPLPVLKYSIQCAHPYEQAAARFHGQASVIQWENGFELVAPDTSKWAAAKNLIRAYGIRKDEVLAIGDGPNDIELLQHTGTGVAMGNASESVKTAADFVTMGHENDGVADYIERFLIKSSVI